jgi:hypothetical protein
MKLLRRLIALVRPLLATREAQPYQPYRPERHYMRGPGPRTLAKAAAYSQRDKLTPP